MRRFSLILMFALPLVAAPKRRIVSRPTFPPCTIVTGTPAVTFSRNGGETTVPIEQSLSGVGYTYGLAVLDAGTLLSAHKQTLSISTDSGCSWRTLGDVGFGDPVTITPGGNGRAYLWSDNRRSLARYQSEQVTTLKPPIDVVGVGVDPAAPDHVRVGGADGSLWESTNGGDTWTQIGNAVTIFLAYRAAFDPANIDHVVFGTLSDGAFVSFDGGRSYTNSSGLGSQANVFSAAVSPANPNIVWIEALAIGADTKRIYLSRNGGRSFSKAVEEQPGFITLVNGALIVPHATDPNVLYFVFGTYFQGYGTDLFRYDAAADTLAKWHFDYNDIDAIAFSPLNPSVMYFGLEVEQIH